MYKLEVCYSINKEEKGIIKKRQKNNLGSGGGNPG